MNETSLSRLNDVVVPEPVPFWPPAPGWYVVGALLFIALLALFVFVVRRYRENAYRRAALRELDLIESQGDSAALTQVPELLKRTALAAWPRNVVAPLSGDDWFRFLADSLSRPAPQSDDWARGLQELSFEGVKNLEGRKREEVLGFTRFWIRHHRFTADQR